MATPLRTNEDKLIRIPVEVQPVHPSHSRGYRTTPDGKPLSLMGVGGITLNLRVGDAALGWVGDHLEPCVSTKNSDNGKNSGANYLSCVGNTATVKIGDDERRGFVTGTHGGCEHVLIDFPEDVIRKLTYGDTIRVEAFGQGLALTDFPDISVMSLDPRMLRNRKWPVRARRGKLVVPVAKLVPARIMGAGLGTDDCHTGDYDIQLFDEAKVKEHGLEGLRLGDIVAIVNADHSHGRIYKTGAVSVGVVAHGACNTAGHGPGVTTLMTSPTGAIVPEVTPDANLAHILGAGIEPAP